MKISISKEEVEKLVFRHIEKMLPAELEIEKIEPDYEYLSYEERHELSGYSAHLKEA